MNSGGAVHSPQILMLSGVGPASHLGEHGIPLIKDISGVGSNLRDHLIINIAFRSKPGHSLNPINAKGAASAVLKMKALAEYAIFGTGPCASNVCISPNSPSDPLALLTD
jgi:choline dehydrogenase